MTTSNSTRLAVAAAAAAAATLVYLAYRRRERKLLKQNLDAIRSRASALLSNLGAPSGLIRSWVDPSCEYEAETAAARRAFFDAHKGVPVPAVVEACLNGACLRVALATDSADSRRAVATVHMAGVQCPAMGRKKEDGGEAIPEPFAREAKHNTDHRR
mgnify:CR=1 FL=1